MQRLFGWIGGGGGAAYAGASSDDSDSEGSDKIIDDHEGADDEGQLEDIVDDDYEGADDIYESDEESGDEHVEETAEENAAAGQEGLNAEEQVQVEEEDGLAPGDADGDGVADAHAEDGEGKESSPDDVGLTTEGGGEVDASSPVGGAECPGIQQSVSPATSQGDTQVDPDEHDVDDSYPRAQDFLIDLDDDDAATLVHEAATIVEGFDADGDDDARTVATHRTAGTRVPPRSVVAPKEEAEQQRRMRHPHQSIFDILDRNFEELGDGSKGGRRIGYKDVKLCFVAFVAVFSLPPEPVGAHEGNRKEADNTQTLEANGKKDATPQEDSKEAELQRVPLSVAFALWKKVLHPTGGADGDASNDHLSYIRSTLVLLGMLDLASIERDRDDGAASSSYGASHRSIECLVIHDNIHRQYGEYLAWGDCDEAYGPAINECSRRWNEAVTNESKQLGSNRYTLRMLPLNTIRAHRMQEAFDLLNDITFVRRRVRVLGASGAAKAHIGDIDELLGLMEQRRMDGDATEPIDEREGLLGAYRQVFKYCLHEADELAKPHTDDAGNVRLGKTEMYRTADIGNALHQLGASLGGYGFFDEEMEYYTEALRLKTLSVNGDIGKSVSASDTLHSMGFSLDNAGRADEALECYDQALEIRYACLGDDDLRVAETQHNKGALLCEEDRAEEAMECLEEALRTREIHYGEEHESCADTMQWMGNLLRKHGDPSDALDYFKFALSIKQKRLGSDDIDVANTLFNTAVLLDDLEKYDLSLVAYREALRIRKLVLGEKNQEVADTLFCLGNVATVVENHKDALEYYRESIEIREALIRDEDDPAAKESYDTLLFISNPASPHPELLANYEKLNQCFEESLPLTKLIFGANHPGVGDLLKRMGEVYMQLQDWDNAVGSFQGALRVKRSDVPEGQDSAGAAVLLRKKGEAHLYKSEFGRAKATFDSAMQMEKRMTGPDSMTVASSTYCLGVAYYYLEDFSHARLLFLDCMRIQMKLAGENDARVVMSLCWIGRQYEKLNQPAKALERYLLALRRYKKEKASIDYKIVAMLLHAIGVLYEDEQIKREEMALKCYNQEIALIHSKLIVDEAQIASALADAHYKSGLLCKKRSDMKKAIEHLEKALELTKQCDGESHLRVGTITDNLGMLYASRQEYANARKHYSSAYRVYENSVGRDDLTTSDCAFRLGGVLEAQGSNLSLDFYKEALRVQRLNIAEDNERVGEIFFCSGRVFLKKGAHQDAVKCFDEALAIRKRLLGDCSDVAEAYHKLGDAYSEMSQHEKALIFYKETVRITKKLGDKGALYKSSLDTAQCAVASERFQLAIESYNDCLQGGDTTTADTARVLQQMGEIQMNRLENYVEATKLLLDALEIYRSVEDEEDGKSHNIMDLVLLIAQAYSAAKDVENSLDYYSEHMTLLESHDPENKDAMADDLLAMGNIYAAMDDPDYDLAIEKLLDCLDIKKRVFGSDDEHVADVVHTLASVYESAGYTDKATESLAEALRAYQKHSNKAGTVKVYHALARSKASQASANDRSAAIECYREALKIRRQIVSLDDSVELASILYELASLLCVENEHEAALPLLEEALRIQKTKNGLKDAQVANILLRMAEVHVAHKKYDSSLVCLEQVSFIRGSLGDDDEIDMSSCHFLLGTTYFARDDYQKSISSFKECMKMKQETYGQNSLECAAVYNDLGKAYGKVREFEKAIESLVCSLKIYKSELGNDCIDYGHSVLSLAGIHLAMTKHDQALNCLNEAIRVYKLFPEVMIEQLVEVLELKGDTLCEVNDYSEAASIYDECLSLLDGSQSDDKRTQVARLHHKSGKAYAELGEYEDAYESYREAISMFGDVLGEDDIRVGEVMYDIGKLIISQGGDDTYAKSMECINEAIRIYRLQGKGNDVKVADALVQKSTLLAELSGYDVAVSVLDEAIDLFREVVGDDAVDIGKAMLLYGRLHVAQENIDEALSNFDEALRIFQMTLGEDDINISLALQNIGICRAQKLEYAEAVESCKQALKIRVKRGDQDEDVADAVFNIANILNDSGEEDEAYQYYLQSLKLYTHLLGEDDLAVAKCHQRLGLIYAKRTDIKRSMESFLEALRICESEDEDEVGSMLVHIYRGIGDCYYDKGEYSRALENFAKCIRIQKMEYGEECIEMAEPCNLIGLIYQKKEKYEEAMNFHSQALLIYEKHHGQGSKICASSDFQIGKVLLALEKYDECIERLCSHLETFCRGSDDTEEVAEILHPLAIAQSKVGKYEESISTFNKAIDIRTKLHGKADQKVSLIMLDLGKVLEECGDLDEAIAVYDQAITIFDRIPDSDFRAVASAYSRLGGLFDTKDNSEASLHSWKKALKIHCTNSESDSIVVGEILYHIGKMYDQMGNFDKSVNCLSEAVKIFRSRSDDNRMVGMALTYIGKNYARKKQFAKAVELITESLKIQKEFAEAGDIAETLVELGNTLKAWGKASQAIKFFDEAMRTYEEVFGVDSVEVARCKHNIGLLKNQLGETESALRYFGEALRTHRIAEGDKSLNVADNLFQIGQIFDAFGDQEKSLKCFEECLKIRQGALGDDHLDVMAAQSYVNLVAKKMNS